MTEAKEPGFSSLKQGSTDPDAVQDYYDDWADNYDDTLESWNYQAPANAAAVLSKKLTEGTHILDMGCGTGLLGKALAARFACRVDGLDISEASLGLAKETGCYENLTRHDFSHYPFPVTSQKYDAAACVGVMTYIENERAFLSEMARGVRPEGYILFTHRDDIWQNRRTEQTVRELEQSGMWVVEDISAPQEGVQNSVSLA